MNKRIVEKNDNYIFKIKVLNIEIKNEYFIDI